MNTAVAELKWMDDGLLPVIAVDANSGIVLMQAWCNTQALQSTYDTNFAHYYSRSRKTLWKKGETSGNFQIIKSIHTDCDMDSIIYLVKQQGDGACHTNRPHCFFWQLDKNGWQQNDAGAMSALVDLDHTIAKRTEEIKLGKSNMKSYTAALMRKSPAAVCEKILEEANELTDEIMSGSDVSALSHEAADLIYHVLVGLQFRGVDFAKVTNKLLERSALSGLDEKKNREKI